MIEEVVGERRRAMLVTNLTTTAVVVNPPSPTPFITATRTDILHRVPYERRHGPIGVTVYRNWWLVCNAGTQQ